MLVNYTRNNINMPCNFDKKSHNGQGNDSSSKSDTKDKLQVVTRELVLDKEFVENIGHNKIQSIWNYK